MPDKTRLERATIMKQAFRETRQALQALQVKLDALELEIHAESQDARDEALGSSVPDLSQYPVVGAPLLWRTR